MVDELPITNQPRVIHPAEEPWFEFCATLRVHGEAIDFEEIGRNLDVRPTHQHRKGERRGPRSPGYRDDAWHYQPPIEESRPLSEHLMALWEVMRPHVVYLRSLKRRHTVDVFCGYRSNSQIAGFQVDHLCLELFTALEIPFGVSIITLQ